MNADMASVFGQGVMTGVFLTVAAQTILAVFRIVDRYCDFRLKQACKLEDDE